MRFKKLNMRYVSWAGAGLWGLAVVVHLVALGKGAIGRFSPLLDGKPWLSIGLLLLLLGSSMLLPRAWRRGSLAVALVAAWWMGRSPGVWNLVDGAKALLILAWVVAWAGVAAVRRDSFLAIAAPPALALSLALPLPYTWQVLAGFLGGVLGVWGTFALLTSGWKRFWCFPEQGAEEGDVGWYRVVVGLAGGMAILSLAGLALATVGFVRWWVLVGLLIPGFVAGLWRKPWRLLACRTSRVPTKEFLFALGVSLGVWALFLLGVLAPETGSDALGGRVALPFRIFDTGRLRYEPALAEFSAGFAGGELFYLWFLPVLGPQVAKAWAWGLGGLLLGWAAHRGRENLWVLWTWLAVFAATQVWWQTFSGFVDTVQGFFAFAAVVSFKVAMAEGYPRAFLVPFFLAGSAATTKINGLALVGALALVVLSMLVRKGENRVSAWCLATAAAGTGAALLPWVVRAFWLTGNPIFPFFNQIFKSPMAPLEPVRAPFGPGPHLAEWLALPWTLFFRPERYAELGAFNPMLLGLVLLLLGRRPDHLFLWVSGVWALLWAATEPNSRYLLPAAFLLLGSVPQVNGGELPRPARWGLPFLITAAFAGQIMSPQFFTGRALNAQSLPLAYLLQQESKEAYLSRLLPSWGPCNFLNQRYGRGYRVWQVQHRDFLYCRGEAFDTFHGDARIVKLLRRLLEAGLAPGEATAQLHSLGFTHVLYRLDSRSRWHWVARGGTGGVLSEKEEICYFEPEFADRGVRLVRVTEHAPQGQWIGCGSVFISNPQRLTEETSEVLSGEFLGGSLVRVQIWGDPGVGEPWEVIWALRGVRGQLLLFYKDIWGERARPGVWEGWQTIPEPGGKLRVQVHGRGSDVKDIRCHVWLPTAEKWEVR